MSNNKSQIINIPNFNTKELITDNKKKMMRMMMMQ